MINIELTKADISDILVAENFQKPNAVIEEYWKGSKEDLYLYYKKHDINPNFNFENLEQLHQGAGVYLLNLSNAIKKDIGQFDFRLRSALIPRNLEISSDDYMKLEFDTSEEDNSEIINNFLKARTRSFIDFKSYEDNKLTLIYNRRGMFDEGNRIAIVKSRDSVTLRDNFQAAKENNFVLSGLLKELVKNYDYDFKNTYMAGSSGERERIITAQEIKTDTQVVENKTNQAIKDLQINQQAQEEIKKEEMTNRQSLKPDSNKELIYKEGTSEVRLDTRELSKVDNIESSKNVIDNLAKDSLNDYAQKEVEKLKIRLDKAKDEALIVYSELKQKISQDGMSMQEALNFAKQKYREEHTVNLASLYLSRDLLKVVSLEQIINSKEKDILNLENVVLEKENTVTKREETISSLKSTIQTKENEIRLTNERHQEDLNFLKAQSGKVIDEITVKFENKVKEVERELLVSDETIIRLSEQNNINEKSLNEKDLLLKSKDDEIIDLKSTLQTKENDYNRRAEELQKLEDKNLELQKQLQEKNKFIEDKLDVLKIFEIKDNQIAEFLKKIDIISDDKNVNQVMNYNNYGSNEVKKPVSGYGNYGNFQGNKTNDETVSSETSENSNITKRNTNK